MYIPTTLVILAALTAALPVNESERKETPAGNASTVSETPSSPPTAPHYGRPFGATQVNDPERHICKSYVTRTSRAYVKSRISGSSLDFENEHSVGGWNYAIGNVVDGEVSIMSEFRLRGKALENRSISWESGEMWYPGECHGVYKAAGPASFWYIAYEGDSMVMYDIEDGYHNDTYGYYDEYDSYDVVPVGCSSIVVKGTKDVGICTGGQIGWSNGDTWSKVSEQYDEKTSDIIYESLESSIDNYDDDDDVSISAQSLMRSIDAVLDKLNEVYATILYKSSLC